MDDLPDAVVMMFGAVEPRGLCGLSTEASAEASLGTALMRARDPAAKLADLIARPLVKVCGLTRDEDVAVAADAGADMAGFVLEEASPRRAPRVLPVPETMLSVAVVVGREPEQHDADLVQLYPAESGKVRGRDAVLLREGREVARVVDLPWEEDDPTHLERARATRGRVMLAGGLGPENVRDAIAAVRPWAVDASSRLEREPGVKDHDRVRAYVEAAR